MTDKLRAAAEIALEALEFSQKMGRSYEIREYHNEIAPQAMYALRQALAEPDMGIDRGAWSDVEDATKWVDELRGDDEELPPVKTYCGGKPNYCTEPEDCVKQEPVAWHEPEAYGNVTTHKKWAFENGWQPLYTAPPKREWQGLTDDEIYTIAEDDEIDWPAGGTLTFARLIEAKLKEKNT